MLSLQPWEPTRANLKKDDKPCLWVLDVHSLPDELGVSHLLKRGWRTCHNAAHGMIVVMGLTENRLFGSVLPCMVRTLRCRKTGTRPLHNSKSIVRDVKNCKFINNPRNTISTPNEAKLPCVIKQITRHIISITNQPTVQESCEPTTSPIALLAASTQKKTRRINYRHSRYQHPSLSEGHQRYPDNGGTFVQ